MLVRGKDGDQGVEERDGGMWKRYIERNNRGRKGYSISFVVTDVVACCGLRHSATSATPSSRTSSHERTPLGYEIGIPYALVLISKINRAYLTDIQYSSSPWRNGSMKRDICRYKCVALK